METQSTVSCGVVSSGPRQFDNDGNCSESGSQRKNSSSKLDQNPTLKEKDALNELKITVYLVPRRL